MNDVLDTALQAFGLRKLAPTKLDLKLLTDGLGRTLPMSGGISAQYVGTSAVSWLGSDGKDLTVAGYSNHGTAFSIISYILTTAAPIPWAVYKLDAADNRAAVVPKHPLADLVYRPNPRQSWAEFKTQCEGGYQVNGQCFIRGIKPTAGSKAGKTAELWCLVGLVEPLRLVDGRSVPLTEFDVPTHYKHTDILTSAATLYPAEEILHLKTWNPNNPHVGLSPIQAGSDAITAAKSGTESRVKQYQNQGPPGILSDESEERWTAEQASGVQRWFDSFFPGRRREGRIPIITGKLAYTKLGLSAVDLDVLAAIPHDKDAVADLFHFPGQLLNGSKGTTFSNMSEAGAALYSRCIIPLETVLRDGLNRWLGKEYDDGVYLDFDVSHIPELQPNKEKLAAWLSSAWFISTQDKQRIMGVAVDDTLPKYLFPSTLVTQQDLMGDPSGADTAPNQGDVVS